MFILRKLILRHCSENSTSVYFIFWLMVCTVIRNYNYYNIIEVVF